MVWRIRESDLGFVAEKGCEVKSGTLAPGGIGYLMPAFVVYEMATFKTKRQAEKYVIRNGGALAATLEA